MTGSEAFNLFKEYGVLDYLTSYYDVLHTFGGEYLAQDIEGFIAERQVSKNHN
jgi:hypothetical protein